MPRAGRPRLGVRRQPAELAHGAGQLPRPRATPATVGAGGVGRGAGDGQGLGRVVRNPRRVDALPCDRADREGLYSGSSAAMATCERGGQTSQDGRKRHRHRRRGDRSGERLVAGASRPRRAGPGQGRGGLGGVEPQRRGPTHYQSPLFHEEQRLWPQMDDLLGYSTEHRPERVIVATTEHHLDQYRQMAAICRELGYAVDDLVPGDVRRLVPLAGDNAVGGIHLRFGGKANPQRTVQAYAGAAGSRRPRPRAHPGPGDHEGRRANHPR